MKNNINLSTGKLVDILTKKTKYCYFVEGQYQRPFVWTLNVILNDFINVIYSFLLKRIEDEYYEYKFGNVGFSTLEEVNKKYYSSSFLDYILSILDGGHRIRLFMCLYIVLLILKYNKEGKEYINIDEYIKVKGGEYKLDGIGLLKDDFKGFYSFINSTKIEDILEPKDKEFKCEKIKKLFKADSDTCEKSMKEVFYFLLYSLKGSYREEGIDSLPEEIDYGSAIDSILNGIILYNEDVPYDEKWEYFRNKNGRGMPLADKYLYSRQLINTIQDDELREKVNLSFTGFDEKCKELEKKKEYSTEYKDVMTFVMSEMYKLILYENNVTKCTDKKTTIFSDSRLGLNIVQCKNKVLIDGVDIEKYFNMCDSFVDFLNNPLGDTNSSLCKTNYLFYDFSRKSNVVTWSIMATSVFILRKYYNEEKSEKYVFDCLLKYMLLYYIDNYLLPGSNVAWFHNGISELNNILYSNRNNDFDETKIKIARLLDREFSARDKLQLVNGLNSSILGVSISGNGKALTGGQPIAIRIITLYFEAFIVDKLNIRGSNGLNKYFSNLYNNNSSGYDLDHIFPKKKFNDALKEYDKKISPDNDFDQSKIGNFVLLESNLNKTKGDDECKNSNIYSQSYFYSTKLLNKNNKYDLSNETLSLIPFKRYNEDELNNPTLPFVDERTKDIANNFINWVFSTYEENKKIINSITEDNEEVKTYTEVVYVD